MVAYKVRKGDGTWYTLGSGTGATAKIRRLDGTWAADNGAGLLAKVRKADGTMAAGVDFSTGSTSEIAWPDALEPSSYQQIDYRVGSYVTPVTPYLAWVPVGSSPWVRSDDNGYVLQRDRPTQTPYYGHAIGVLPSFNIRDYVWLDGGQYRMRGGVRWGVLGGNTFVTSRNLAVHRWTGSAWVGGAHSPRRAFVDTSTPINTTLDTDAIPWAWPNTTFPFYTDTDFQPGGTFYDAAAAGNYAIGAELEGDWATRVGFGGDQYILVWSLVLLPPPDGFSPLSAGD